MAPADLADPATFEHEPPWEHFADLREQGVTWQSAPGRRGPGFWVLTRHADVVAANRDAATFSSGRGGTMMEDRDPQGDNSDSLLMLNNDPPHHTRLRRLVNRGFTPKMVASLHHRVREIAVELIDTAIDEQRAGREIDFVESLAAELPLQMIAELLGVPRHDRSKLFDWSNRLIGFDDPEFNNTPEDSLAAAAEMWAYANELAQRHRAAPANDIVGALLEGEVDGERLTEMEYNMFVLLLSVAGNETTRNAISHGALAFMRNPDQWQLLRDRPELIPSAVEEIIRWATPVMYFRRTATCDTELGGQLIREGEKVTLWYLAANRDERVFDRPHAFDITRDPNEHVAFGGGGPHFCLGASLARLEIAVMFDELVTRAPGLTLAGDPRRLRSNFINGIKQLPVRL